MCVCVLHLCPGESCCWSAFCWKTEWRQTEPTWRSLWCCWDKRPASSGSCSERPTWCSHPASDPEEFPGQQHTHTPTQSEEEHIAAMWYERVLSCRSCVAYSHRVTFFGKAQIIRNVPITDRGPMKDISSRTLLTLVDMKVNNIISFKFAFVSMNAFDGEDKNN